MKCLYCGEALGENCLEGGFCSFACQAGAEHEEKLRQNEHMSIHLYGLDDGGYTVEIKLRDESGCQEMTRNYEAYAEALNGIAELCTTVVKQMEEKVE